MELIGLITKLLFFSFWPVLLLFLYYLTDKKGFKKFWQEFKNTLFK
jgi:hypothetical protein